METDHRFDPLFQAHHDQIYRYCVRRLGRTDAEDATAEVFAVAWRRLDEMPEGDAGKAWLYGVAYRVVGNQYRSRRRRGSLSSRLTQTGDPAAAVAGPESAGEFETLYAAIDRLSANDRELLRLSSWDGLTRAEIAKVLGIRENAVDQRLHRARSRLKNRLDQLDTGSSRPEPKEASA